MINNGYLRDGHPLPAPAARFCDGPVRDLSNKEVAADRPKLYEHLIGGSRPRLVWKKNAAARATRHAGIGPDEV